MKKISFILMMMISLNILSQQIKTVNYYNWRISHSYKEEPEKWNRFDYKNYTGILIKRQTTNKYFNYYSPTIVFSLKGFKWKNPNKHYYYTERKTIYNFIY